MPMNPARLKTKMKMTIYNGLKKQFKGETSKGNPFAEADEMWLKLADAISDSAADIILEIITNAQVAPGIATNTGATVAPGKVL